MILADAKQTGIKMSDTKTRDAKLNGFTKRLVDAKLNKSQLVSSLLTFSLNAYLDFIVET